MGNIAVINLTRLNKYFETSFFQGETVLERVLKYRDSLPDLEKTIVLLSEPIKENGSFSSVVKKQWNEEILFDVLKEESEKCSNIIYFWGDYPLLDSKLTSQMYENHLKYYAGYTFADGYPKGLSPEFLRSSDVSMLYDLSRGSSKEIGRNSIFEILQKDINAFDIETEISPVDLRMYRISLSCDNKRNSEQLQKLIEGGIVDRDSLLEKIDSCKEFLRSKPAYYQVQITDSCPQKCFYCPFSEIAAERSAVQSLSVEKYSALLEKIVSFSDDAHIALSAWGEPSLHENFIALAEETMKRESLKLLIETSGLGWRDEDLVKLAELNKKNGNRISWIVSLDALDKDLYNRLRGEGYDEAWQSAHRLFELFGDECWVQAVRMKENEENLEEFFRYWKKSTANIIIQKYDWFCGTREQKKITDLSPLKRDPCWHIKRDMFIRLNGDVPLCREDLSDQYPLGNIYKDELEEIWMKGDKFYKDHLKGEYSPMCRECDEYYTFNF